MPERIQRRRTPGWRMPTGAVYVGRPTRWGNPFVVGGWVTLHAEGSEEGYTHDVDGMTADQAVAGYRDLMESRLTHFEHEHPDDAAYADEWRAALEQLRGRDLVCWCPLDQPCHADVLLELANPGSRP